MSGLPGLDSHYGGVDEVLGLVTARSSAQDAKQIMYYNLHGVPASSDHFEDDRGAGNA